MKKILFFSLLATAMLFAACGDSNDEATPEGNEVDSTEALPNTAGTYKKGGIISLFFEPDTLQVIFYSPTQGNGSTYFYLSLASHNGDIEFTGNNWWYLSEEGQKYVKYYGDTTFSGWINFSTPEYTVSAMPLNSINVVADKDFDSEHPAGASLNDIFTLQYASAWNLIQSNYNPAINIHQHGHYQTMPLSEFKELFLPFFRTYLYFNKLPEKLGTYEFTITFDYGKDPISGREAKVAPAVVKAEFTEKDYVKILER